MLFKQLHRDFKLPTRSSVGAGGYDIYLPEDVTVYACNVSKVKLGFAAAVPEGYVAIMAPRSGSGTKGVKLANTIGVIDSDYRGEWQANITWDADHMGGDDSHTFRAGDRILQFMLVPIHTEELMIVNDLDWTVRGAGGFGSTGI